MKSSVKLKRIEIVRNQSGEFECRVFADCHAEFEYVTEEYSRPVPLTNTCVVDQEHQFWPYVEKEKLQELWDSIAKSVDSV